MSKRPRSQSQRALKIGTRGSDLALWQARYVSARLQIPSEIVVVKTAGDRIQHVSLDKVEGKGFFTKEIEAALLDRQVDVAVHSFKDLPIESPAGLTIAAVPARGPVRDIILAQPGEQPTALLWGLVSGAKVGTSSLRRKAQLLSRRPDLNLVDLRGNVPTRVKKAASRVLDAVVLAEAGLLRLGINAAEHGLTATPIAIEDVCPAPAQGALAVQIRDHDDWTREHVARLHDAATAQAVDAERLLLGRFGGGCHLPLGAYCQVEAGVLTLAALVAAPDGHERIMARASGATAEQVANSVHADLVKRGAERYL